MDMDVDVLDVDVVLWNCVGSHVMIPSMRLLRLAMGRSVEGTFPFACTGVGYCGVCFLRPLQSLKHCLPHYSMEGSSQPLHIIVYIGNGNMIYDIMSSYDII